MASYDGCGPCVNGRDTKNINIDEIIKIIEDTPGVISLHDLHVWSITSGHNALSCHIVVDGNLSVANSQDILASIEHVLSHKEIHHVTIQVESPDNHHKDSVLCRTDFKQQIRHEH